MPRWPSHLAPILDLHRDDLRIVPERLVDRIEPPRFFPLIGAAQRHVCSWKCTVHYTETIESYLFPFSCRRPRSEVVYIDDIHLHLCPCGRAETAQPKPER